MCGIVGYLGKKDALPVLVNCLKKLEYRGYDSSGFAFVDNNVINIVKEKGFIAECEKKLNEMKINSHIGIAHTRWATHGAATSENAHPHKVRNVTLVHNGIIENYVQLKTFLKTKGYRFKSETDTEVVAALIDFNYKVYTDPLVAISKTMERLEGSYALAIMFDDRLDTIYGAKFQNPLIIGGDYENKYIASDIYAILEYTNKYILIDDLEIIELSTDKTIVYDSELNIVEKKVLISDISSEEVTKVGYKYFMEKEINEQPGNIHRLCTTYLDGGTKSLIKNMPDISYYYEIDIIACGSAYHAGLIGKYLLETYANIKTNIHIASEYRYNKQVTRPSTLVIIISQSGETADSLACLRLANTNNMDTLAIVNVEHSSIAREAKYTIFTKSGPEIAVATTKAFLAQVACISMLALNVSVENLGISSYEANEIIEEFKKVPEMLAKILEDKKKYLEIAKKIVNAQNIFFIGRGLDYSLCAEGSLKLKEISYIHSDAYPAGELKHGTISLIEPQTPVFALISNKAIAPKTISNIKEVKARDAFIILISNTENDTSDDFYDEKIILPHTSDFVTPLLYTPVMQYIAYYVSELKGLDVDKPRNLAKSVTVE